MRTLILALTFLASGPAIADECDALAARIVEATGATFDRRANQFLHFKGPAPVDVMSGHCPEPGFKVSLGAYAHETALPPAAFFDAFAKGASISIGAPAARIRADAVKCQKLAFKDADGDAYFDVPGYQMTCTVGHPSRDPRKRDQGFSGFEVFKQP